MIVCDQARKFFTEWDANDIVGVDVLFGKNGDPNDGTTTGKEFVSHLQNCPDCKNWLNIQVPDDEIKRYEKIQKYCCVGMFHSVEEAGWGSVSIEHCNFRGEHAWFIEVASDTVGGNLIGFCPWCGTELPKASFTDDISSKG